MVVVVGGVVTVETPIAVPETEAIRQKHTSLVLEYYELNRKWFEGKLPTPPPLIANCYFAEMPDGTFVGMFDPPTQTIYINVLAMMAADRPWERTVEVLLHEMIHLSLWRRGFRDDPHGEEFQEECKRVGLEE